MRLSYVFIVFFCCYFASSSSYAQAQQPELSVRTEGAWTLASIEQKSGQVSCLIGVVSDKGELRIRMLSPTRLVLDFRLNDLVIDEGKYLVWLKVDQYAPVKFSDTLMDDGRLLLDLQMTPENVQLLRQSIDGERLKLLSNLMSPVAEFSLMGSGKAISFLRECESR